MKKLLILDAGHGFDTKGKCNAKEGFYEFDFNNKMQYLIKEKLKKYDIEVVMTNPYPHTVSDVLLSERVKRANNWFNKYDQQLFISLHANAYSDPAAKGTETYTANVCSVKSENFAKMVNEEIFKVFKSKNNSSKNRGVKKSNFYVIKNTNAPAVLIEYGFYTNADDLFILKNYQNELADATVKAICKYFNLEYKETKITELPPNDKVIYRVVAGSYSNKENAIKLQKELKNKGFDSFIIIEK